MESLKSFVERIAANKFSETKIPVLFVGHGNPMNAIEPNQFHKTWAELGRMLPIPKVILTISAHWLTKGITKVTAMHHPKTIHDFGGFPSELYAQNYPVNGSPEFAVETKNLITSTNVELDYSWGLDHGTWSILLPMYPSAKIPVYQLSIDYSQPPAYHYKVTQELGKLREKGVLIIGSGNIVHNLQMARYDIQPYDWAIEFDERIKNFLSEGNHQAIVNYSTIGSAVKFAVPTNDHFLPLIYAIGLQQKNESVSFFNDAIDLGSVSMRSVIIH